MPPRIVWKVAPWCVDSPVLMDHMGNDRVREDSKKNQEYVQCVLLSETLSTQCD